MEWNKYTIVTAEEAEEIVCALLGELEIYSVEIEDKKPVSPDESGGLFGDVVPELPEDDHIARISFYLDADEDPELYLARLRAGLKELSETMGTGESRILASKTAEEDWINNWKEHFQAFRIDDILIRPTWQELTEEEAEGASMVLRIDPGTAFGTGKHESTQLAIHALRKYIKPGMRFLDIGTGSGILGIIALKSGAESVFGTDLDPNTLPAIKENLVENEIPSGSFTRILGNLADDREVQDAAGYHAYDVACANIIAEILAEITPQVPFHLREGGVYITSGILREREDLVREAARKAGLTEIETNRMGEWSCIVFSYLPKQ